MIEKIEILRDTVGADSVMLHYPPWYGQPKALASLELFASEVIPKFKTPTAKRKMACLRQTLPALILRSARRARLEGSGRPGVVAPSFETRCSQRSSG